MSRPRRKDSGHKRKMKISNRHSFVLKVAVESIMIFAAEWFSLEEMKALQGVCVLASVWAKTFRSISTESAARGSRGKQALPVLVRQTNQKGKH